MATVCIPYIYDFYDLMHNFQLYSHSTWVEMESQTTQQHTVQWVEVGIWS